MLGLNKIPGWTANVKAIGMKPGTAEMVVVACIVVAVVAVGAGVAWAATRPQKREGMDKNSLTAGCDEARRKALRNAGLKLKTEQQSMTTRLQKMEAALYTKTNRVLKKQGCLPPVEG